MSDCQVTFCNAVYHPIALERKGTLVTLDTEYMKTDSGIVLSHFLI